MAYPSISKVRKPVTISPSTSVFTNLPKMALRYKRSSAKVRWNIKNSMTAKMGIAHTLCVSTLSILSDFVRTSRCFFAFAEEKFADIYLYLSSAFTASRSSPAAISASNSFAPLCASSISSFSSIFTAWNRGLATSSCAKNCLARSILPVSSPPRTVAPFLSDFKAAALSINSFIPVFFSAEIATTGTLTAFSSAVTSILSPALSTSSIILRAIITGTSISSNCVVRYRLRSKLVASTIFIMPSGFSSSM